MNTLKDKYIESACSKKGTQFQTSISFNDTKIIVSFAIDGGFDFRNFIHDKNKALETPIEFSDDDTLANPEEANDNDESSISFISID